MEPTDHQTRPALFTVGHSNHSLDQFLDLLKQAEVQVLVDVRSYPYSRYVPHFNREEIETAVKRAGLRYLFLGRELGGRPDQEEYYDDEGRALYYRIARSPDFLGGIERLEAGIRRFRVAVMCSEENPAVCHRHLLVGRVMRERGAEVRHIRGDGSLQDDSDLRPPADPQRSLFDPPEESTWKSLQPVSHKRRLGSSPGPSSATGPDG